MVLDSGMKLRAAITDGGGTTGNKSEKEMENEDQ